MVLRGKRLGCGIPRVYITPVGGNNPLAEVNVSSVSYSRRLDEMSDARIVVSADQDARCTYLLGKLEAWRYELSIYRDSSQAWVGPVMEPTWANNSLTITARDLFAWFERRILPHDRAFVDADLSLIAAQYLTDALEIDLSPNIQTSVSECGVLGTRSVLGNTFRRAADEIRELSRSGLDFTTVNREVKFGGKEIGTSDLPILTADIFEIDSLRKAGLQMANHWFVLGATPSGVTTPLVGEAGGLDLPVVQLTVNESTILDIPSATAAAETRWDLLHEAPEYISGTLMEDAPVSIDDLIPGAHVEVRQQVGFRYLNGVFRLVGVDVQGDVAENGTTETVRLGITPLGSEQG